MKSPKLRLAFLRSHEAFRRTPWTVLRRIVTWRLRCLLRLPATVSLDRWGIRLFLPARWRGTAKLIYVFRDRYEPELAYLERVLSPGAVMLDVGANFGIYSLVAGALVGDSGQVLAFEPETESFEVLKRNVSLNDARNVRPLKLALSDSDGEAHLFHHREVGRSSLARDRDFEEESEVVPTRTLDGVARDASLSRLDVLKVDVEGAEELVLRGGNEVLTGLHPLIILESIPEHAARLGLPPHRAKRLLEHLGYRLHVLTGEGDGSLKPLQKASARGWNIIAVSRAEEP